MEKVLHLLGLVIVANLCVHESDMTIQNGQTLCTSLCFNGFSEETSEKLSAKKTVYDNIVEKKCNCKNLKPDYKRRRRSIATSKPQPTTSDLKNQTIEKRKNATENKIKKSIILPGYSPHKDIRIVSASQDMSNYSLKLPDKNKPRPTMHRKLLKNMYPHLYKASTYCNYSAFVGGNASDGEGEEMKSINVFFEDHGNWSFNVTWVPPPGKKILSDYVVLWSGRREDNDPPGIESNYVHCKKVPKNQTNTVIQENNGWKYPQDLFLAVVTVSRHLKHKRIALQVFNPIGNPRIIPVPPRETEKNASLQTGSIAGGVIAGVAFILVLFVLLYRKRCGASEIPENEIIMLHSQNNSDGLPKIKNADSKPRNVDTYFASYLPESEKYSNEVATIAGMLRADGYRVMFDQVDSVELNSMGFNLWVEKQILEAKKYIVFCSPGYIRLWQTLATNSTDDKLTHVNKEDLVRVRYEIKRITDIYSESCSTSKIICIKMDPKMGTKSLPPWMNHNMLLWPEQKYDIMRRLNDQAAMVMDL